MEQLGCSYDSRIHSTRLKDKIQAQFPDIESYKEGHEVLLVFKKYVSLALKAACAQSLDDNSIFLAKAAELVRCDMMKQKNKFDGNF